MMNSSLLFTSYNVVFRTVNNPVTFCAPGFYFSQSFTLHSLNFRTFISAFWCFEMAGHTSYEKVGVV